MAVGQRTPPPYGGPEETSEVRRVRERRATHPGVALAMDQRMHAAEERAAAAEEVGINLGRDVADARRELREMRDEIMTALNGPKNQPELGLVWKVAHIDERDRDFRKIKFSIVSAAVLAFAAWLIQLYVTTHR